MRAPFKAASKRFFLRAGQANEAKLKPLSRRGVLRAIFEWWRQRHTLLTAALFLVVISDIATLLRTECSTYDKALLSISAGVHTTALGLISDAIIRCGSPCYLLRISITTSVILALYNAVASVATATILVTLTRDITSLQLQLQYNIITPAFSAFSRPLAVFLLLRYAWQVSLDKSFYRFREATDRMAILPTYLQSNAAAHN